MATDMKSMDAGPRDSLLDVILTKVSKLGKNVITSRLVYVARFQQKETGVDNVKAQLFKIIDKHSQDGEITGFLLAYPVCYIHVIEGKTPQLMAILRDVIASGQDLRLSETRVVSSTEDVASRYFNGWYSAFVPTASTTEVMDPLDAFGAVKAASDINTFLRKAGHVMVSPSDADTRRKLQAVEQSFEEVPAQELVLSLTPTEDAPTLSEFLDIFDAPINVDLESEQVWPMPPPLKY